MSSKITAKKILLFGSLAAGLSTCLIILQGCNRNQPADLPNILFITLDTTRADHLSCYGYKKAVTPYLQGLSEAGCLFEKMYSCVPITLPSHTTMLTGLIPPEHGIRVNGENALAENIPVLAEILKANGYSTGAVVASSVLDKIYGLNRGFDYYNDNIHPDKKDDQLQRLGDQQKEPYRLGVHQAQLSIEWLEKQIAKENKGTPWFLWSHFYDPHEPTTFHKEIFGDHFSDSYDAEITYMDMHLGRLLDFLGQHNLKENTLVVIAGDHGEGLGDHGEQTHCFFLYQTTQHVPCIITWKGAIPAGLKVDANLSLADLMPTILDLINAKLNIYKPRKDGRNKSLQNMLNRSFANALRGEQIESRRCYMETLWGYYAVNWAPMFAIVENDYKFIRAPKCELFNLAEDPNELKNIYTTDSRLADDLAFNLEELEKTIAKPEMKEVSISAEQLSKLQSLGYTSGSGNSTADDISNLSELPDPKDMKEIITIAGKAAGLVKNNPKDPKLINMFQTMIEASPRTASFHAGLGNAYAAQNNKKLALECYSKALALDPHQLEVLNSYGMLQAQLGRLQEALPLFENAYNLKPHDTILRDNLCLTLEKLGMQYGDQNKFTESEKYFQRIIELRPNYEKGYFNMSMLMIKAKNFTQAKNYLKKALEIKPDYERAIRALKAIQNETSVEF